MTTFTELTPDQWRLAAQLTAIGRARTEMKTRPEGSMDCPGGCGGALTWYPHKSGTGTMVRCTRGCVRFRV